MCRHDRVVVYTLRIHVHNRGHLSASTPSPSGLAPVYKSSLLRVSTDTDTDVHTRTGLGETLVTHAPASADSPRARDILGDIAPVMRLNATAYARRVSV